MDRFDISGQILQKIPKTRCFEENLEKNLYVVFGKLNHFDHVSDDIPVQFHPKFCTYVHCSDDNRERLETQQ